MEDIATFLADVFQAMEAGKSPWARMIDRLGTYYNKKFHGTGWREQQQEYLEKVVKL
jgi:hypothetical protein